MSQIAVPSYSEGNNRQVHVVWRALTTSKACTRMSSRSTEEEGGRAPTSIRLSGRQMATVLCRSDKRKRHRLGSWQRDIIYHLFRGTVEYGKDAGAARAYEVRSSAHTPPSGCKPPSAGQVLGLLVRSTPPPPPPLPFPDVRSLGVSRAVKSRSCGRCVSCVCQLSYPTIPM